MSHFSSVCLCVLVCRLIYCFKLWIQIKITNKMILSLERLNIILHNTKKSELNENENTSTRKSHSHAFDLIFQSTSKHKFIEQKTYAKQTNLYIVQLDRCNPFLLHHQCTSHTEHALQISVCNVFVYGIYWFCPEAKVQCAARIQ